jgi:hypothetical protein
VRIKCTKGHGIIGATVQGHWIGADTTTVSGTTSNSGRVKLRSAMIPTHGTTRFIVDRVVPIANPAVLTGRLRRTITGP